MDTIRASGGNNAKRFILIEGLGYAKYEYITTDLFKLPNDKTKDRLIPAFHEYPMGANENSFKNFYTGSIKQFITDVKPTGAVKGNNFEVKSETVIMPISEKLAAEIEDSTALWINGKNIVIKSIKVVQSD